MPLWLVAMWTNKSDELASVSASVNEQGQLGGTILLLTRNEGTKLKDRGWCSWINKKQVLRFPTGPGG